MNSAYDVSKQENEQQQQQQVENPQQNINQKDRQFDYSLKIVFVGDSSVGKSSIIMRYTENSFKENYFSTIGVDFKFKLVVQNQKTIKLQIWDTAGQEKFRSISNAYYKGADAIVIVFDKMNQASFNKIPNWIEQISEYADEDPFIILVGNKNDAPVEQQIKNEIIQEYVQNMQIKYYDVSAKQSQNIDLFFSEIIQQFENQNKNHFHTRRKSLDAQKLQNNVYFQREDEDNCCFSS